MKKQIHILEGIIILTIILIAVLLLISFLYHIKHEQMDTTYMWNINFNNLKVTEGSNKGNISLENNNIKLDVLLKKEGEFYEFTLDIENSGTLDAKLEEINLKHNNPKNILKYNITYLDGTPIKKDDILESNSTKTIKLRITYPKLKNKIYDALELKLSLEIKYTAIY